MPGCRLPAIHDNIRWNKLEPHQERAVFGDEQRPIFPVMVATFETLAHLEFSTREGRARAKSSPADGSCSGRAKRDGRSIICLGLRGLIIALAACILALVS